MQEEIVQDRPLTPILRKKRTSITMSFPDAINEIINGKKVRRLSWPDSDYGLLKDGWLSIFTRGSFHTWSVNDGDMEGQDWMVINASN
jgi:hypothetical protein